MEETENIFIKVAVYGFSIATNSPPIDANGIYNNVLRRSITIDEYDSMKSTPNNNFINILPVRINTRVKPKLMKNTFLVVL